MSLINDENFLYTEDELVFRDLARKFVEKETEPIASKVETVAPLAEDMCPNLMRKMGQKGFTVIMIPERYGGLGKSLMYQLLVGYWLNFGLKASGVFGGKYFYEVLTYMKYRQFPA